jgi:hypothetical protein
MIKARYVGTIGKHVKALNCLPILAICSTAILDLESIRYTVESQLVASTSSSRLMSIQRLTHAIATSTHAASSNTWPHYSMCKHCSLDKLMDSYRRS